MEGSQLLDGQGGHGVSPPLIVAEFDFGHRRGKYFNNSSHLAANKAMLRQVPQESHFGKKFQLRHGECSWRFLALR